MVGATSRPHARAVCGLMLADLAVGAQRLALIDRIRGDEGIERLAELELLEIEADPGRASGYSALSHITLPAWVLAGEWSTHRLGALEWSALERLAGAVDPPLPVRRRRARLAAELAPVASLLGDDATALRWLDLVDRDWRVLRADMEGSSTVEGMLWEQLDMLAIQRAYIELRAGRVPARPRPQAAGEQSMAPGLAGEWRELEGVLDFASRGALDLLRQGSEMATFARDLRWENKAFEGVEVAARGSGDELARWLAEKDSFAIRVALLGATRIQSGREAMRSWLRGAAVDTMSRSLAETAAGAASRQKIAQALGDDAAAAEHGACAARLRRALLRRDTALVRRILRVE